VHGHKPTPIPRAVLDAAKASWPEQIPQAFSQAAVFKADGSASGRALAATYAAFVELGRQADAIGARVIFVALPTKPDLDHDDDETQAKMLAALDLTPEDMAVNARMGARLLAELKGDGRETLDLLPPLREAQGPLYWRKDYHLNVTGHAAVAAALLDVVGTGE